MTPLITVLLPCRRPHRGFLDAAVGSMVQQTSQDWLLLGLVDDEPDERVLLDAFDAAGLGGDPRVGIARNETRRLSGKINTGMRRAATEFVCLLLSDDEFDAAAVEVLTDYIRRYPYMDFFHTGRVFIDEAGTTLGSAVPANAEAAAEDFVNGSPVKHLMCWRREFGLAIGGIDESLGPHGADDYDFPWTAAEKGCRFQAIQECLYRYRDHREHFRLTTHVPQEEQEAELRKIWRKHGVSDEEMASQLRRRREGYLQQALFRNEQDREQDPERDAREGWRITYKRQDA